MPTPSASEKWFVIHLEKRIFEGPFGFNQLHAKLKSGEVSWFDIGYRAGSSGSWVRIVEIPEFMERAGKLPDLGILKHFRGVAARQTQLKKIPIDRSVPWIDILSSKGGRASDGVGSKAEWHLILDEKECGPLSLEDIESAHKQGEPPQQIYAWCEGMPRWKPISQVAKLRKYASAGGPPPFAISAQDENKLIVEHGTNRRKAMRRRLVASISRVSSTGVKEMIGVCGDINLEGVLLIQEFQSEVYKPGDKFAIEVNPMRALKMSPLRAAVTVRWYDRKTHFTGLQFLQMEPMDRKFLETYLRTLDKGVRI